MKPMTAEWVAKAEGDFAVMERESRVGERPTYDVVARCRQFRAVARIALGLDA